MIQPDEHQHHTIWTPELVEISLPLAGIARRCMAMIIDQFIVSLFIMGVFLFLFMVMGFSFQSFFRDHPVAMNVMLVVAVIGVFFFSLLIYFAYFWGFHTFNRGQTLGKMWLGIRVVTDRGGQANAWTCFVRSLFDILDWILCYGGVGAIMILMTKQEKRIADFAAGTIVIFDR